MNYSSYNLLMLEMISRLDHIDPDWSFSRDELTPSYKVLKTKYGNYYLTTLSVEGLIGAIAQFSIKREMEDRKEID